MGSLKALDLYCGAGGITKGLQRAGFHVTGVDLEKQPRYCGDCFIQGDATAPPVDLREFDFIHASPPCQRFSAGAAKWGTQGNHLNLIPQTRELLIASGKPYTIENIVPAAPHLINPIMLCGTFFDLGVFRHRLIESSFLMLQPAHAPHTGKIGDGKYQTVTGHAGGSSKRDGWKAGGVAEWRIAMGIEWMTGDELAEAIPPAYAEFVARAFLAGKQLGTEAA
jgi:DNA (cytosine-5)-methyltransferase 1